MNKRLNARIDDELAQMIQYLRQRTHQTATEIIRTSIEHYYREVSQPSADPRRALAGFIGCVPGPRVLSAAYKRQLTRSLRKKS